MPLIQITDDVKKHFKSTIKNLKNDPLVKFKDGKLSLKFS